MREKTVLRLTLLVLIVSVLTATFQIQQVRAVSTTIYIRADGSIDPLTAPISTSDNVTYTLTDNIASLGDGIVVERNNVTIDGNGFTLHGGGDGRGFNLTSTDNVTIKNTTIEAFYYGVWQFSSSNSVITNNYVTANTAYSIYIEKSTNVTISNNNVTDNYEYGVEIHQSQNVNVTGNFIKNNNGDGIYLSACSEVTLKNNTLINNGNNLILWGGRLSQFMHDIDTSNTIDGKQSTTLSTNTISLWIHRPIPA